MLHVNSLTKVAAALAVAAVMSGAGGLPAAAAPPDPKDDRAATTPDPAAVAALTRMGEYIAGLNAFELTARTTLEAVLRGGHQVEMGGTVRYFVQRPNRMRIDSETDAVTRQYFFDGDTFTVVAPLDGYFARTAGQGTIRDTLVFAAQTLNVELPLADLFEWGAGESPVKQFARGFFVGTARIDGTPTEHYAFIGKDLDLEVWIVPGAQPLPLKMSLVDHRAPGSPRFSATLSWVTAPKFADDVFTFKPGKDVVRIEFAAPAADRKGGQ